MIRLRLESFSWRYATTKHASRPVSLKWDPCLWFGSPMCRYDGYWLSLKVSIGGRDNVQMRGVDFHMVVEQAADSKGKHRSALQTANKFAATVQDVRSFFDGLDSLQDGLGNAYLSPSFCWHCAKNVVSLLMQRWIYATVCNCWFTQRTVLLCLNTASSYMRCTP